jgi:hypothetical protein
MLKPASPDEYKNIREKEADGIAERITAQAQETLEDNFDLWFPVPEDVQSFLRDKLIALGFASVEYERESGATRVTVKLTGNPFSAAYREKMADLLISKLENTRPHAGREGNKIKIVCECAPVLQPVIRQRYLDQGWKDVQFTEENHVSFVVLFFE